MFFPNHGYDSRTFIGYIQKDTREFVLLGQINGTWGNDNNGVPIRADGYEGVPGFAVWNGLESSFTSYNPSFTFDMVQWHHEKLKEGKYVKNVAYFLVLVFLFSVVVVELDNQQDLIKVMFLELLLVVMLLIMEMLTKLTDLAPVMVNLILDRSRILLLVENSEEAGFPWDLFKKMEAGEDASMH